MEASQKSGYKRSRPLKPHFQTVQNGKSDGTELVEATFPPYKRGIRRRTDATTDGKRRAPPTKTKKIKGKQMEGIKMKKIELKISGMHCDSCKAIIEDELNDMDGIKSKNVALGSAVIEYDEKKTNEAAIKKLITGLGYKVV